MTTTPEREIGNARKRIEDPRLVHGGGQYVDDLRLPGALEVAFVRSTYAHARIKVDLEAARRAPGVLAAWLGERVKDTPALPLTVSPPDLRVAPMPPTWLRSTTSHCPPSSTPSAPSSLTPQSSTPSWAATSPCTCSARAAMSRVPSPAPSAP
jgi:aldehyde oxidase/xanthine dehydrogenase-like protein